MERASMLNSGGGLSGYSGMTMDQVQGLASLLDDSTAGGTIQRPEGQSTGYSLAETDAPPPAAGENSSSEQKNSSSENDAPPGNDNKLVANSNPGAIFIPDSVKNRQVLPQPSTAKKIVTGTVSTLGGKRRKPKGNDIWTTDEVDMESNIAPAPKIPQPVTMTSTIPSSTTTVATTMPGKLAEDGQQEDQKKKPLIQEVDGEDDVENSAPSSGIPAPPKSTPPVTTTSGVSSSSVDRRKAPEYEILYKQMNTAEDVYLSMDFTRDGSTAMTCDQLAVKVQLPLLDKGISDIELDVDTNLMTLRTRDYLLKAPLPEPCVPKKGKAQWDDKSRVLTVTLNIDTTGRKVKVM